MIIYTVAKKNELDALRRFLGEPSVNKTFVKPLLQRPQTIAQRVLDKYEKGLWILAKDNSKIIGCLALVQKTKEIEISTYAVAEGYRRQGIGSVLIDNAIEVTKSVYSNYDTIILTPGKEILQ